MMIHKDTQRHTKRNDSGSTGSQGVDKQHGIVGAVCNRTVPWNTCGYKPHLRCQPLEFLLSHDSLCVFVDHLYMPLPS